MQLMMVVVRDGDEDVAGWQGPERHIENSSASRNFEVVVGCGDICIIAWTTTEVAAATTALHEAIAGDVVRGGHGQI